MSTEAFAIAPLGPGLSENARRPGGDGGLASSHHTNELLVAVETALLWDEQHASWVDGMRDVHLNHPGSNCSGTFQPGYFCSTTPVLIAQSSS